MPAYGTKPPVALYPGNQAVLVDTSVDVGLTNSVAFSTEDASVGGRYLMLYNGTNQAATLQAAASDVNGAYMAMSPAVSIAAGVALPIISYSGLFRLNFAVAPTTGTFIAML